MTDDDRVTYLLEESKKFSAAVGLPDDIIIKMFKADSDSEFILKLDALLEAAVKEVIKRSDPSVRGRES